jgi:hypothetical protein
MGYRQSHGRQITVQFCALFSLNSEANGLPALDIDSNCNILSGAGNRKPVYIFGEKLF